ncbi:MAG: hypothetical protein ACJA0V_002786 [Planctomycetota bacterium]|jgi:hypothetical protein
MLRSAPQAPSAGRDEWGVAPHRCRYVQASRHRLGEQSAIRDTARCGDRRSPRVRSQIGTRSWPTKQRNAVRDVAMKTSMTVLGLALLCALPSCGGVRYFAPNNPIEDSGLMEQVREQCSSGQLSKLLKSYYKSGTAEADRQQVRNMLVSALVLQIDNEFEYFATRTLSTRAFTNTSLDTAAAGLAIASTIVGHTETAKLLSGIGAGVLGLRLSIDKEFFYEQSTPILIAQMQADRDEAYETIATGVAASTTDYPLTAAVRDMGKYYQAGTLFNAFAQLAKQVNKGSLTATSNPLPRLTVQDLSAAAVKKIKITFTNKDLPSRSINVSIIGYDAADGKTTNFHKTLVLTTGADGTATQEVMLVPDNVTNPVKRVDVAAPTSTPLIFEVR